jgi:5-deoxy-5-amino-3-dehydroquinate synthase
VITVEVDLGNRSYPVVIGSGAVSELAALVPGTAKRAFVVTQERVGVEVDPGIASSVVTVRGGEQAKSFADLEALCRSFSEASLSRSDLVVAVGGGVVTDLAGLAAALYHRGIAYINVSTTLLGQVDAAIGGKTAVNLPEGKNLVGAFWQPTAVICDTDTLETLDPREISSGRGEMAKYAFLGDDPPGTGLLSLPIDEQVATCVRLKAGVVTEDETESDRRAILNYGHTLAHALEATAFETGWDLRHGEAVAIGLVFAAELAERLGRIDDKRVELHREVVAGFGLSFETPPGASAAQLVGMMRRDKKAQGDLTFVLDGPNGVELVRSVDPLEVTATLVAMGCEA